MIQKTKKVLAITFTAAAVGFALVDLASGYNQPNFNPCVAPMGDWCYTVCTWDDDHPWWCFWCEDEWDCTAHYVPLAECDGTCVGPPH